MAISEQGAVRLRAEIQSDPLGQYSATMTDAQVLGILTALTRSRNREFLTGDEMRQQTAATEWDALTTGSGNSADQRGQWLAFTANDQIDPFAAANVHIVQELFGTGSLTIQNLAAIRVESISRLTELSIGTPTLPEIAVARAT